MLSGIARTQKAARGPVVVLVQDRDGTPIHDVQIDARHFSQSGPLGGVVGDRAWTDATGRAAFVDLPYDGSVVLHAEPLQGEPTCGRLVDLDGVTNGLEDAASASFDSGGTGRSAGATLPPSRGISWGRTEPHVDATGRGSDPRVTVSGPELSLRLDRGLPVRVTAHEAGQGPLRPDVATRAWPTWTHASDAARGATLALIPGETAAVWCTAEAPEGWLTAVVHRWDVIVHPLAQRLTAVVPLRPELDLVLDVPSECRPYRLDDCDLHVQAGATTVERPQLSIAAEGRVRVAGAGYRVGERVHVSGTIGPWSVEGSAYLGEDARDRVVVPLAAAPAQPDPLESRRIVLGMVPSAHLDTERLRVVLGIPLGGSPIAMSFPEPTPRPPVADLPLRIVAWNGAPAVGARVTLQQQTLVADADGRVRFPGVAPGSAQVRVVGAGAVVDLAVEAAEGTRHEQVLAVPAGGTLEVEVVDARGRALPYPELELAQAHGLPYLDCVDGTQRLDPYGDAEGRRTYRFVSSGEVTVTARFGSRAAQAKVQLADGAHERVRLVLPHLRAEPQAAAESR